MEIEKIYGLPEIAEIIKISENEFKVLFKNQEFLEIKTNEKAEITHISGNIKEVGNFFLSNKKSLEYISFPFLERVGRDFLFCNENLESISFPLLKEVGYGFLFYNEKIESISLPTLEKVGSGFLFFNKNLESISLPLLKEVGNDFLFKNKNKVKIFNELNDKYKKLWSL